MKLAIPTVVCVETLQSFNVVIVLQSFIFVAFPQFAMLITIIGSICPLQTSISISLFPKIIGRYFKVFIWNLGVQVRIRNFLSILNTLIILISVLIITNSEALLGNHGWVGVWVYYCLIFCIDVWWMLHFFILHAPDKELVLVAWVIFIILF